VKAKLALEELPPGADLLVLATDPEAAIDLAAWAADAGLAFDERATGDHAEYRLSRP
jgi:TusA-related sulfurtransferase